MHIVNVIYWSIMTDEGRGWEKILPGMKTRRLWGDLITSFQYLRAGYQQDESRLSTDGHGRKKKEN